MLFVRGREVPTIAHDFGEVGLLTAPGSDRVVSRFSVDGETLRADVERTATFGAVESETGRGRTALPGDAANRAARDYLVERLEETGLDVRVDAVGNVVGRWTPAGVDPETPAVAAGSHLDSVPRGGIFDGVLGVYAALEAVRAISASETAPDRPLDVVCFTGEEGTRFADGVLGSTVAAGKRSVEDALAATDGETTLEAALDGIGYHGEGRLDASAWNAWLELHVDQSHDVADAGVPLGVVTDITGTSRIRVRIEGEADHAGTTAMGERRDALAAASEVVLELEAAATETASDGTGAAVGTVGELTVEPNVVNVVPGAVSLRLDIRSIDQREIQAMVDAVTDCLGRLEGERGVETTVDRAYDVPPTPLAPRCQDALYAGADRCGLGTTTLHSGAGHDTMQVADVTDAGLAFVASNGHSHSPRESADWADCTAATRVLAESLWQLASTDRGDD